MTPKLIRHDFAQIDKELSKAPKQPLPDYLAQVRQLVREAIAIIDANK